MQTVNFSKSGNVVTAVCVGDVSVTVVLYSNKFKFQYDEFGNVMIVADVATNKKLWIQAKITNISFTDINSLTTNCTDITDMQTKVFEMFIGAGDRSKQ